MNISNAFSYLFKDEKWLEKVLLGGLFVFLCIFVVPIPLLAGYLVELMGNVARGERDPLPVWNKLAGKYKNGLWLILINVAYNLPPIFLRILRSVSSELGGGFLLLSFWLSLLIIIYHLVVLFVQPVATLHFAVNKRIEDAFDVKKILGFVRRNFVDLLVIFVMNIVLVLVAGSGLLIIIIGALFTSFYALAVRAYLYGSLYREKRTPS